MRRRDRRSLHSHSCSSLGSPRGQKIQRAWVLLRKYPLHHPRYETKHQPACMYHRHTYMSRCHSLLPVFQPLGAAICGDCLLSCNSYFHKCHTLYIAFTELIFCCITLCCSWCQSLWEKYAELLHLQRLEMLGQNTATFILKWASTMHLSHLCTVLHLVSQVYHWSLVQLKYYAGLF